MDYESVSTANINALKKNEYPGRGIILGMTKNGKKLVQVYWIMGRSENSRNRIFEKDNGFVRTRAFDESKVTDPSLIIYYPVRHINNYHIVTNGDQTDTIFNFLKKDDSPEAALMTRKFEPDAPHFTPRISGVIRVDKDNSQYSLSILKSGIKDSICQRQFFTYDHFFAGFGHCIHTYEGNGNPIPSFSGEPLIVPVFDTIEENADFYWSLLNQDNKISLLIKMIDSESNTFEIKLTNKNK